jgi:cation/acetate symporter
MGNSSASDQALNITTIAIFLGFVAASLAITWWAARNTKSKEDYFAAGRSISAWQNGLALAGDFMGAATLLGTVGLITLRGFDGITFAIGALFRMAASGFPDCRTSSGHREVYGGRRRGERT